MLYAVGFFGFLIGCVVVSTVAGSVAARVSRWFIVWAPLTLAFSLTAHIAFVSVLTLIRCCFNLPEGDEGLWERLAAAAPVELESSFGFGVMFGVVGWVWCLKRTGEFLAARSE